MEKLDFGKKLIEIRKAKNLTQDEVAEKCNVSVRTIQRIESGSVKPRAFTIRVISDTLGSIFSRCQIPVMISMRKMRVRTKKSIPPYGTLKIYSI